jgi:4-hydroxybenzoate polyprenyltransferase
LNDPPFHAKSFGAMARLRTLLVLGRTSNLPTVWSNCLAGWWLGGHGDSGNLPFLFAGATFLYVGGMYLNDAFDVDFDRQHRKERPIPSGAISFAAVCKLGLLWLAMGVACLFWVGIVTGLLAVALMISILIYDATHKVFTLSPLLMGWCRFLVYLVAASSSGQNDLGWPVWCGMALACYVAGLSFVARRESARGQVEYWSLALLAAPIVLAFFMNTGDYRKTAAWLSLILGVWMLRCLRRVLWTAERNIGRTVAGLLAGIVFVDWLAALDGPWVLGIIFLALFGLALLFQRFVPAT